MTALLAVLAGDLVSFGTGSDEHEEEPDLPPARQNELLRAYFRKQYVSLRVERQEISQTFMERYVDRQIDSLLDDIDQRLGRLVHYLHVAQQGYEALLATSDPSSEQIIKKRLAKALEEVDDAAGGLKAKLVNIFMRLDSKEKLPVEFDQLHSQQKEMEYLTAQVTEAEKRIRDYFFRACNTVPYQSLKGENMLIRLYWVEKTAEKIRKQLAK